MEFHFVMILCNGAWCTVCYSAHKVPSFSETAFSFRNFKTQCSMALLRLCKLSNGHIDKKVFVKCILKCVRLLFFFFFASRILDIKWTKKVSKERLYGSNELRFVHKQLI